MQDLSLVIFCLSAFVVNGEYQPGTPGKTWDADEIRVVRNKVNIPKSISNIKFYTDFGMCYYRSIDLWNVKKLLYLVETFLVGLMMKMPRNWMKNLFTS